MLDNAESKAWDTWYTMAKQVILELQTKITIYQDTKNKYGEVKRKQQSKHVTEKSYCINKYNKETHPEHHQCLHCPNVNRKRGTR